MALAFGLAGALTGCNDSFMDRYPETSITEESFFTTVNDLEIYTNNMYGYLGGSYWDAVSDNMSTLNQVLPISCWVVQSIRKPSDSGTGAQSVT